MEFKEGPDFLVNVLFLANVPATTIWKARHKMAYYERRLLLDYSIIPEEDSGFFFISEQIKLAFFFRNGSHLRPDLEELLIVDITVVNTVVMWGQKSSRYGVIQGASCAQYFRD